MATTARLQARINLELHAALKRAAELEGHTMTDFVVSADQECFAQARLSPPGPAEVLQRALERRRRLLGTPQ